MATYKNDSELLAASKHLDFEMIQFNYCIERLARRDYGDDVFLHNTLLTAFAIHTRNLQDFFYGQRAKNTRHDDDMFASDYFHDPSIWTAVRPVLSATLKIAGEKVDKHAAHLTYTREAENGFYWLFFDIHKDLKRVVGTFVDNIPHHRLEPHVVLFRNDWAWSDLAPHSEQYKVVLP